MANDHKIKTLGLFCGSYEGNSPIYRDGSLELAQELINRQISLVYGGGGIGLMGLVSNTLYRKVPKVTGIIPKKLYEAVKNHEHREDELIIVDGMHERKALMYEKADAFIALPGGVGTLEEIMEVFTWLHLGYHRKPVGLLDTNGFYQHLMQFLIHSSNEGFLKPILLNSLCIDSDPPRLLEKMEKMNLSLPSKFS
ncbi:MAG: TIGR00730 family Rossman fold protein [Sphaerochaetaceae bacterium]|jgi:hypothetical protein|nr:TIGR00730 family Rossman fold protein [Sphaerochaetaceae bacterium]MDD2405881.1 TIGR00730 family Rossman fold protein [Sphaerochaetaceae bacterium]MDD3671417.1 TIGR00730 family Rossman fold protein [Sphaerochaetaceae bacterium]MDD4258249.1 TIGR00730 family Rossman fold protein [Sphaerochaetaceae bacterium]MDD4763662.1 TIGR00730 family Rossman fold protein [Sphaerochaetaceae bacterium]